MGNPPDPNVAWNRLSAFQARAAYLMECDIARRADVATLGTTMQILGTVGSPTQEIIREHPPVAEIDQAAARLRPVTLQEEDEHWSKMLRSLDVLTRTSGDQAKSLVARLRKGWRLLDGGSRWSIAVSRGPDNSFRSEREIAKDYLYGELAHGDQERRERLRYVPETDKYLAALGWVRDGILLVRASQQLIATLEEAGELRSA